MKSKEFNDKLKQYLIELDNIKNEKTIDEWAIDCLSFIGVNINKSSIKQMDGEEWKNISGYEELYKISNYGRMMSYHIDKSGRLMNLYKSTKGYKVVDLRKLGHPPRSMNISRLVALTFIPNPENKPCVNHKDGNKLNDFVKNLDWCTYSENTIHAINNDLIIFKRGKDHHAFGKCSKLHPRSKPIVSMDRNGNVIGKYESIQLAAKKINGSTGYLCKIIKENKTYKGLKWKYENECKIL